MKKFTLTNGKTYDESYFEKLSDEAAKGNYPGTPGKWAIRPQGRPKLARRSCCASRLDAVFADADKKCKAADFRDPTIDTIVNFCNAVKQERAKTAAENDE